MHIVTTRISSTVMRYTEALVEQREAHEPPVHDEVVTNEHRRLLSAGSQPLL